MLEDSDPVAGGFWVWSIVAAPLGLYLKLCAWTNAAIAISIIRQCKSIPPDGFPRECFSFFSGGAESQSTADHGICSVF